MSCVHVVSHYSRSLIISSKRRSAGNHTAHLVFTSGFNSLSTPRIHGFKQTTAVKKLPVATASSGTPVAEVPTAKSSRAPEPGQLCYWLWKDQHVVAYEKYGSGDVPLLLVHGMGACHEHWNKLIPELGAQYSVYALDLLGFGDSAKPEPAVQAGSWGHLYSYETWAQQISDFVHEVVKAPAIVVGNSAGGLSALLSAVNTPHLMRGLVLLDCTMRHMHERNQPPLLHPFISAFQWVLHNTPFGHWMVDSVLHSPGKLKAILRSAYGDPSCLSPQLLSSFQEHLECRGSRDVLIDVFTNSVGPLAQDLLPFNTVPTVVVWGSVDPWEPVTKAEEIFEGYVADFVVLPGVGHFPQDEVPNLISAMIDTFTEECAVDLDAATAAAPDGPGRCRTRSALNEPSINGFTLQGLMAAAELDAKV